MSDQSRVTSVDYERPYRPPAVAMANRVGRLLGKAGVRGADLRVDGLLAAARARAGLEDFGDDAFLGRLGVLIDSVEREANLHPLGRRMARENFLRILCNRLRMRDAFKRCPGILDLPMQDPVFVVGLQRTGTTLLHRLLASDPSHRFLASWEAVNPAPLPVRGAKQWARKFLRAWVPEGGPDPRIRWAVMAAKAAAWLAPDFFAIHPVEAHAPEEDVLLFDYDFWSTVPESTMNVPACSVWLEDRDHTPAYEYYRDVLKLLYRQRPVGRWVLKTPHHLEHLDALLKVFPGAKIIQPHRDPLRVVASFCSMIAHARGIFSDVVDPAEVGRHWSRKQVRMVTRAMEARDKARRDTFIDVAYEDLVADPIGQLRRVYAFIGVELTPYRERRMREFMAENPQHKYGRHRYGLEHFGLDRQDLEKRFAAYRERFNIKSEQV
ncbi:MAG: sulfotransferase [Pseudomonadota bacterium]